MKPSGVKTRVRQTDTRVIIKDDHRNDWEDFTGEDINPELEYYTVPTAAPYDYEQSNWQYRGQASMCKTHLDTIVRVRIGDGTASDRQIWYQVITDPTNEDDWNTWTLKYSGTWYAVAVFADPGATDGYRILHASSTTIKQDNVSKITQSGVIRIIPVQGLPGYFYYTTVSQGDDGGREMNGNYCSDIDIPITGDDHYNFYWNHYDIGVSYSPSEDLIERVRATPHLAASPRDATVSDSLSFDYTLSAQIIDLSDIYMIKGASGRAGTQRMHDIFLTDELPDYTYVFYTMSHWDDQSRSLSNLHRPLYWQRCRAMVEGWTQPTPVGFSVWGFAGVVEFGDYLYACGNGRVLRRSLLVDETDISNYVMKGELSAPRDNQDGTGSLTCANPDGVLSDLLGMQTNTVATALEKNVTVELGLKRPTDDDYAYGELNDWYLAGIIKQEEDNRHRLELKLGDYWYKLSNEIRETYEWPGKFAWFDWQPDGSNDTNFWYAPDGTVTAVYENINDQDSYKMQVSNGQVFSTAPARGHSFSITCDFVSIGAHDAAIRFRYDPGPPARYYQVKYHSSGAIKLEYVSNNVATVLASDSVASGLTDFTIQVEVRHKYVTYTFDGVSYTSNIDPFVDIIGSVGAWCSQSNWISRNWSIFDYEAEILTSNLIRAALGFADILDVEFDDDIKDVEQISVLWGPQTDIKTGQDALKKLLEGNDCQAAWVSKPDGTRTVRITQYGDTKVDYTLVDNVISTDQLEEADLRPNVILVDGNENSWTEYYEPDLTLRGRAINKYFDLPELNTQLETRHRALTELDKSISSTSPGGTAVWQRNVHRLDNVRFIDRFGTAYDTRIEGLSIEFDQGVTPFQRMHLDLSPLIICTDPDPIKVNPTVALDSFEKTVSNDWGDPEIGNSWTLVGTAANFDVNGNEATISLATNATRWAYIGPVRESSSDYAMAMGIALTEFTPQVSQHFSYTAADLLGFVDAWKNSLADQLGLAHTDVASGWLYPPYLAIFMNLANNPTRATQDAPIGYQFPKDLCDGLAARGIIPYIWISASESNWYTMSDWTNGDHDDFWDTFVADWKAWSAALTPGTSSRGTAITNKIVIRPNWEMNETWFPWGKGQNSNTGTKYIAAWRHNYNYVHHHHKALGIYWHWCPWGTNDASMKQWFPGDAYIDFAGFDRYTRTSSGDPSMRDLLWPIIQRQRTFTDKPMIIGEMGVAKGVYSTAQRVNWIDGSGWSGSTNQGGYLFFAQNSHRVRGLTYFNIPVNSNPYINEASNPDWDLTDPSELLAYAQAMDDTKREPLFIPPSTYRNSTHTYLVKIDPLPTTGYVVTGAVVRLIDQNNFYAVGLKYDHGRKWALTIHKVIAGVWTLISQKWLASRPLTDTFYDMKVKVTGSSPTKIEVKFWLHSNDEPLAYRLTHYDNDQTLQEAGRIGLFGRSFNVDNDPVTVTFDDFEVRTP